MSSIGNGVEFFPNVEPDYGLLYVHARGNLSIDEKDALTQQAEAAHPGLAGHQVGLHPRRQDARRRQRHSRGRDRRHPVRIRRLARAQVGATHILADLRVAMVGIPGVDIEVSVPEAGPPTGKAIQIQLVGRRSDRPERRTPSRSRRRLARVPDVIDIVGRPAAARRRLGAGGRPRRRPRATASRPTSVGAVVQLVTTGLKLSDYRPAGAGRRGGHRPAPAGGSAHDVGAGPAAHRDRARLGADLELRHPQGGADRPAR